MLKMPQARDLITNWLRTVAHGDVMQAFTQIEDAIREAKSVWEEAAKSLDSKNWRRLLEQHPEYQRIVVLDSLRKDLHLLWTDKYVLHLSVSPDVSEDKTSG